jgi:hypothetical protein
MLVSIVYTIVGYFFHEKIRDELKWDKIIYIKTGEE